MSAHKSHKQKKSKKPSIPEPPGIKLHKLHLINVCLLILVGTILYFNTLNAPFLFDDIRNILESSWVKTPENFLNHYFEDEGFYKHRIIPYGTFALNWHFNRDSSLGYHIVNLAIHILNSLLVYLITLKLLSIKVNNLNKGSFPFLNVNIRDERDRVLLSSAVALLFISHPIQTNAVIYIVQRIEAITAFFYLLSFYLFIKAVHLPRWGPKKAILYTGNFCAFIMALYSKEVALSLPLLMIVYYGIFGLKRRKISLIRGMLLLLSAGSIMGLSAYILYSSGFHSSFPHWSGPHLGFRWGIKENLYTQANVIMEYIKLLVLPLPGKLNIDHDFPLYKSIFQFPTYLSVLTIIALNLFALLKAKKFPLFCFCILWWFITLIPSSSIWPIWDIMVEYRTYLPGFAFYLFLVLSIHQVFFYLADNRYRVISKHIRLIEGTLLTLLVLSYLWGTYERSFVWRDPISLWMDSSKKSPHKARPHNNLGMAYFKKGRLDEAIAQYEQTLAISPNYAKAHNNLGAAYAQKGLLDEAIPQYRKAITIKPNFAQAHSNLGSVYNKKGSLDEAISQYKKALAINPNLAGTHSSLGIAYAKNGRLNEAITEYEQALALDPYYAKAHNNLGMAYAKKGLMDEAISQYRKAITIKPNLAQAHSNLGNVYNKEGSLDEAISQYKKALAINPNFAGAHSNLSATYLKKGEYPLAIKHCDRAIELGFKVNAKLLRGLLPYR